LYARCAIIGCVSLSDALLQRVAEQYGTPTYIYDLEAIGRALGRLRRALPEARIHYAVKANPNGAVLRHLAAAGVGAEVITLGELRRALAAGIPAKRVLLGGPGQDTALIHQALGCGVRQVSLDSLSQWRLWQAEDPQVGFLVRLNPALDPRTHEHLATGAASSKFGMPLEEAGQLAEELAARGQLLGFHVHAGSQIGELAVYEQILAQLAELYQQFPAGLLDIGGGFAVPNFPLAEFATRLRDFIRRYDLQLVLEPGRYLVAEAGFLLTRVVQVKAGPVNHVIADAGMADLLRPALYGALHPIRLIGVTETDRPLVMVDIDGPLCENADRLGRARTLPSPRRGDLLLVEQAGAYGFTMASNYASSLRPAEVAVRGGELILARRRETVEDLLRLEDA